MPWLDLEVEVGQLRGLGAAGIDHDHRSLRVAGDLLQRRARAREAVRHPRVLADEQRNLGVLEVGAHDAAEHLAVHPELAGLLLRQRVRAVPAPERPHHRPAVGAAEMIALPAAAVVEDRLATVLVADRLQPGSNLGDRRLPVDLLVGAVGATPERVEDSLGAPVLVVIEAQRLLAGVALRGGVRLVAADPLEPAAIVTEAHFDTAVALAEDARRLLPVGDGRPCEFRHATHCTRHRSVVQLTRL